MRHIKNILRYNFFTDVTIQKHTYRVLVFYYLAPPCRELKRFHMNTSMLIYFRKTVALSIIFSEDMSAYIILETNFVRLKTDMHLNIHKTLIYVPQTKRRVPVIKTNPL